MDISKIIYFKHCSLPYFCARLQLHSFTRDVHISIIYNNITLNLLVGNITAMPATPDKESGEKE